VEAASTSETSVSSYQTTRRNVTEDNSVDTCRRENLKSRQFLSGELSQHLLTLPAGYI
jgi:hypothetical protein